MPSATVWEGERAVSRRVDWMAAAMLAVAIGIRLPYLNWGLPELEEEALPLKKAFDMWGWEAGRLQLDPMTAGWPSLSFYLHLLLQQLIYFGGRLSGAFANRYDFWLLHNDLTPLVLAARGLGVLAAGGTVYVATRLGKRLGEALGGLFAGGLLTVSPLLFQQARLITPDILLTFCVAMAVARLVDLYERGTVRDYVWTGIWIGLGVSIKYSPALLIPALYVVHVLVRRREMPKISRLKLWLGAANRRFMVAMLACLLVFFLTSPFVVLNLEVSRADVGWQFTHMSEGHFGQEGRGWGSLFYVKDVLVPAFGWPGFSLAIAGLVWGACRRRGAWLVPAVCFVCLYLGLALLRTQFDKYMLPVLFPLALGLAAAAQKLSEQINGLTSRRSKGLRLAAIVCGLIILLPPAWATGRLLRRQSQPTTVQQARQYLLEMPGSGELVYALEAYTPSLPIDRRAQLSDRPIFARLTPSQRQRLRTGPTFRAIRIPMYMGMTELSDFYYDLQHYLPADVIVTSSAVRDRYEREPERYQRQVAFYRSLEQYAELVRVFSPGPRTSGPALRIYRFTDAGRQRWLRERPPKLEFVGKMKAPHVQTFLRRIAAAALEKGMTDVAKLYFEALREVETRGGAMPSRTR